MGSNKVYVGNLPFGVNNDQLAQKFAEAGNVVSANVITDKFSGRSRGFGFVEFDSEEAAKKAIELFNRQPFGEGDLAREMIVDLAQPPKERPDRQPRN